LAVSKPYSAILIALPALILCFSRLLQLAWQRGETTALTIWAAVAAAMLFVPRGQSTVIGRHGLPVDLRDSFAPYLEANAFVLRQLAVAVLVGAAVLAVKHRLPSAAWERVRTGQLVVAVGATTVMAALYGAAGKEVVFRPQTDPVFRPLGEAIRAELPENAALILDVNRPDADPNTDGYHLTLMFWADRSVYRLHSQLAGHDLHHVAAAIRRSGGLPLLVSDRPIASEPALSTAGPDGLRVYPMSAVSDPEFSWPEHSR
jgi:hypothetical protein